MPIDCVCLSNVSYCRTTGLTRLWNIHHQVWWELNTLLWYQCLRWAVSKVKHRTSSPLKVYCFCSIELKLSAGQCFQTAAKTALIGRTVLTRYNCTTHRIDDILFDKNPMSTFDCQGELMSFSDYYKRQYYIDVKDRGQPLLLYSFVHKLILFPPRVALLIKNVFQKEN